MYLTIRLADFLDEQATGDLTLIGGGGEAIVFYDAATQEVVKFFAPPCKAKFGWMITMKDGGPNGIRPGVLDEALLRYSLMEELFPSGLEIDCLGEAGDFLLLRQPFILGEHPTVDDLHAWMRGQGWAHCQPQSEASVIRDLTWRRGSCSATDVRPENALMASSDGELRAIDFIVHGA